MSGQAMNTPEQEDPNARFDAAVRTCYRDAAAHVSPRVRWRLHPHAARGAAQPAARRDWRLGTAFAGLAAAVFALAIGLNLRAPVEPATQRPAAMTMATDAEAPATTSLDEDPDFYAWLADDADLVAME